MLFRDLIEENGGQTQAGDVNAERAVEPQPRGVSFSRPLRTPAGTACDLNLIYLSLAMIKVSKSAIC